MVSQIDRNLGAELQLIDVIAKLFAKLLGPLEHMLSLPVVKILPELSDSLGLLLGLRFLLRIDVVVRMKRLFTKFFDIAEFCLDVVLIFGEECRQLAGGFRPATNRNERDKDA